MIATLLRGFEIRSTFSINSFCYFLYFPHLFGHLSLALAENPGPQGKLGFPGFPRITEIDGVNFGYHTRHLLHLNNTDLLDMTGELTGKPLPQQQLNYPNETSAKQQENNDKIKLTEGQ